MPTRKEIEDILADSQKEIITYFQALPATALESPCTANGVPDEAPWRAKDHLAHLAANEHDIQELLRRTRAGDTTLPGNRETLSREEFMEWRNQSNQTYVNAHHDDSVEKLCADLTEAREQTLVLLAQFTDEQLAAPASGPFGADKTVGDMFVMNARHEAQHVNWIEEGFRLGF